jgi:hypothetical protein
MSPSTEVQETRKLASEVKFLVEPAQAEEIRKWARARLSPDPNADSGTGDTYRITSLYFDTDQLDVFRRKGSYGRSKLRIRRYGLADGAFLERKLRTKELVGKRRSFVSLSELGRLAGDEPERGWNGFWFHRRLVARALKPVCQITYLRTARVAATDRGTIRLTVDEDLRTLPLHDLAFDDTAGGAPVTDGRLILELKYTRPTPALFKELVEEFQLTSAPISKYRFAAVALGCAEAASYRTDRRLRTGLIATGTG